jgi:hypothetical protein
MDDRAKHFEKGKKPILPTNAFPGVNVVMPEHSAIENELILFDFLGLLLP